MVRILAGRPEGYFSNIREEHSSLYRFFALEINKEIYAYAATRIVLEKEAEAHTEVLVWNKSARMEILKDWSTLLDYLKKKGVSYVFVINAEGDSRWPKFIKLLGFGEIKAYQVARMEV